MNRTPIVLALEPVLDALEAMGISFHLTGSVASSAYGIARATVDVDIVADLREQHVREIVRRLQGEYYIDEERVLDAVQRRSSFNAIHLSTMLKVDVFVLKGRAYDQVAFGRARKDTIAESEGARQYPLASPEDLILNKLEWYRQGGEVSERQWDDVIGILKVQRQALDFNYMLRWAGELGLTPLFQRAVRESGL
ncbi:MAG TPA: hypothetical protein VE398_13720 [Acidobacteriota bacterium]|nr:hypothetical protein [Acidobacteriota bacterium]